MNEFKAWRIVLSIALFALVFYALYRVWNVLVPFLLGLVLAYLIQPLVDRFVGLGLRRDRIVLVLYGTLVAVIGTLAFLFIPALVRETNEALQALPQYAARLNQLNDSLSAELSHFVTRFSGKKISPLALPFRMEVLMDYVVSTLPGNISHFAHAGLWIFIIPFVCYFALAQGKNWINAIFDWTPSGYVENLLGLMAEVNATLGGYVRGQLLDSVCVGLITMVGLWLLGFQQSILMGLLCAFLNPVPFLAPVVGGALTLMIGYFQGMTAVSLIGICCLFILVRLCDDFFFTPFIVGQSVKLHPLVMLFAILAGVELGGFLGLVFAVPVAAVIKVVLSIGFHKHRPTVAFQRHNVLS